MDDKLKVFKLPIEYTKFVETDKHVIDDLELNADINPYSILFGVQSDLGKKITRKWKNQYSDSKKFIKQQQFFLKNLNALPHDKKRQIKTHIENANNYYKKWNDFKNIENTDFLTKYQFIDWKRLTFLNSYPIFLQAMTYYNLASPLFHILLPFILLIVPFILIKLVMKVPFSLEMYKSLLYKTFQNHAFGKICTAFTNPQSGGGISTNTKLYAIFSVTLYIFTFYQNILSCIKFYKNIAFIQSFLYETKEFMRECKSINNIINIAVLNKKSRLFNKFQLAQGEKLKYLNNILENYDNIDISNFNIYNISNVGTMMHNFHQLFFNGETDEIINYWFGYYGFIDNMTGLVERINKKEINYCDFIEIKHKKSNKSVLSKKMIMNDLYYVNHINSDISGNGDDEPNTIIKNNIHLDKNIIITGPNASGKTTVLKSVCINILFSQQLGAGCYSKFKFNPYNNIQSYVNIPDTSSRDSLFQAESRRCLNIIQYIERNPKHNVFCIFDELFSGTNPYEAQKAATSYLKYLNKLNIQYMLTTHFMDLTKIKNKYCKQCFMNVIVRQEDNEERYIYTYKISNGVSDVFGGFKVLKDLNFPNEIIQSLS